MCKGTARSTEFQQTGIRFLRIRSARTALIFGEWPGTFAAANSSGRESGLKWYPTMPKPAPLDLLYCPLHAANVRYEQTRLVCEGGHEIPVENGIPIFAEKPRLEPTPLNMPPLPPRAAQGRVDGFVDDWIVNTNGNLYWQVRGCLPRYPTPHWPATSVNGAGQVLVDLGCGWGRWSIAAARAGFSPCGVDVHLDALRAGKRVARELGISVDFVCSDITRLPFKPESVDFVFSYSVLQHMEKTKAKKVLNRIAFILRPGGTCLVQLPNVFGLVSLCRQLGRGFREPPACTFAMRYWRPGAITRAFREAGFRSVRFRAEGFLVQNTQREDLDLLTNLGAAAVLSSCALRTASIAIPPLARIADSLWIEAAK
jgi:2-polyprenyl-3-methyl-5-hydroxy-6-metoxy-1,4-benzoquinol methylase